MAVDPRRLPHLSSATVAIDPTRVRDVSALLNLPAALPASAAAPVAFRPTLADETAPKWEPSMLMRIGGILNGQSRDDLYRERDAELAQDALLPQLQALKAAQLKAAGGLGGRELLAYMTNQAEYGKNLASRYGAHKLSGGDTALFGEPGDGGSVYTAPKYQIEDHTAVEMGPAGLKVLGQLPRKPEFQTLGKDQALVQLPGSGLDLTAGLPKTPQATADAVWQAAIMQESGGRPGVIGPDTAYGNAQGLTQMLPATAKSMAEKLGVAWVPELMTAATPEAAAYQEKLGRAYFDEGMAKYGGDPAKALAYYHGGPDERIWGPKTRAHVSAVLAKAGMSRDALAGGAGADEVATPGGARVIATGPTSAPAAPSGYRWNGEALEFIPGGPADPAAKSMTLKFVPAKIQEGYVGNSSSVRQIDAAIAAIEARPESLGLPRMVGENINQRVDPDGVDARAAVANIGSLLIHDRSGAAVTAAEAPRLMPFIPRVTDTSDAAIKKLRQLKTLYQNANSEIEVAYGEDRGYRPVASQDAPAAPKPATRDLPAPVYEMRNYLKAQGRLDPTKPPGSRENPFVARSQEVIDKLMKTRPGAYVITPEGDLGVLE